MIMGFRKYGFAVVCAILFHILVPRGSAGRQRLFLDLRDFSLVQASPDINEDAVRGFYPISLYKRSNFYGYFKDMLCHNSWNYTKDNICFIQEILD